MNKYLFDMLTQAFPSEDALKLELLAKGIECEVSNRSFQNRLEWFGHYELQLMNEALSGLIEQRQGAVYSRAREADISALRKMMGEVLVQIDAIREEWKEKSR